jgi:hypothetical protein
MCLMTKLGGRTTHSFWLKKILCMRWPLSKATMHDASRSSDPRHSQPRPTNTSVRPAHIEEKNEVRASPRGL